MLCFSDRWAMLKELVWCLLSYRELVYDTYSSYWLHVFISVLVIFFIDFIMTIVGNTICGHLIIWCHALFSFDSGLVRKVRGRRKKILALSSNNPLRFTRSCQNKDHFKRTHQSRNGHYFFPHIFAWRFLTGIWNESDRNLILKYYSNVLLLILI